MNKLTYEDCISLKNAGFPQPLVGKGFKKNGIECAYDVSKYIEFKEDYIYLPSLEEIIEQCGEGFDQLTRSIDQGGETYWWASSINPKLREFNADSPIIAVKNLYCALNPKKI